MTEEQTDWVGGIEKVEPLEPKDTSVIYSEIAEVIGEDATAKLFQHQGGGRLYVPHTLGPDHYLNYLIGAGPAKELSRVFAGESVDLPNKTSYRVQRDQLIGEEYARGLSAEDIRRKYGLALRTVRYIIRRQGKKRS